MVLAQVDLNRPLYSCSSRVIWGTFTTRSVMGLGIVDDTAAVTEAV
jgi:hypothetical protein